MFCNPWSIPLFARWVAPLYMNHEIKLIRSSNYSNFFNSCDKLREAKAPKLPTEGTRIWICAYQRGNKPLSALSVQLTTEYWGHLVRHLCTAYKVGLIQWHYLPQIPGKLSLSKLITQENERPVFLYSLMFSSLGW